MIFSTKELKDIDHILIFLTCDAVFEIYIKNFFKKYIVHLVYFIKAH